MDSLGFPGVFVLLLSIGFYALVFFVLWKFYQIFSKINDNVAGIRQVLNRSTER